jgi:hypothetical protein
MDLDEICSLGEVWLDLPQLSDEQSKYIILLVGTFLDHTLHEVPRARSGGKECYCYDQ